MKKWCIRIGKCYLVYLLILLAVDIYYRSLTPEIDLFLESEISLRSILAPINMFSIPVGMAWGLYLIIQYKWKILVIISTGLAPVFAVYTLAQWIQSDMDIWMLESPGQSKQVAIVGSAIGFHTSSIDLYEKESNLYYQTKRSVFQEEGMISDVKKMVTYEWLDENTLQLTHLSDDKIVVIHLDENIP